MKSIVFREPNRAVLEERDIPSCKKGEVLLKLICSGVCGTDIQVFMGRNKFMKFPVVPLHEGIAKVCEVSEGVSGLSKGDLVAVRPILNCGVCRSCKNGRENACESFTCLGVQTDGLGSEYVTIDRQFVHKISKGVDLDKAVLIEPFAVGVHAARRGRVANQNVMVIGGGTIGNFTAQAAKLLGAKRVAICDISEDKIRIAHESGIDCPVNTSGKSFREASAEAFGDEATDVIIDCVGAKTILPQILDTAWKVSTVVIVGNYSEKAEIDVTKIQRNELDVFGCITYTKADFETAVQFIEEDKVYTKGFITGRYPMSDIQNAMENAVRMRGVNMKTVIEFE